MRVTAWKNGSFSNPRVSYGIRVGVENRNRHFQRQWRSVVIQTDDGLSEDVRVSDGFWKKCPELRHNFLTGWFKRRGLVPWPERRPPEFDLNVIAGNRFLLRPK